MASKRTILARVSLAQTEVDALEKQADLLRAIEAEHSEELAASDEELGCIMDVLADRGIDPHEHAAYQHAVYADELNALTMSDMQLHQITALLNRQVGENEKVTSRLTEVSEDEESASVGSDGHISDDLVYEDD